MTPIQHPRRIYRTQRPRWAHLLLALLAAVAAAGVLGLELPLSSPSTDASTSERAKSGPRQPSLSDGPGSNQRGAGGSAPVGANFFDGSPGVVNLDPMLLSALREAATDAADAGIDFVLTSGWRSPEHQERLLEEGISKYGSREEAARWVATPETSAHVRGEAVDIGPAEADNWLAANGVRYGLCQIYENEPWHFELRSSAIDVGCPPMYSNPTEDPRMRE